MKMVFAVNHPNDGRYLIETLYSLLLREHLNSTSLFPFINKLLVNYLLG